jgi:hypothetical protein
MSRQMGAMIDKLLSGVLQAYKPEGFIAEQIFTPLQAAQYTGKLGKLSNSHLRIQNTIVGGEGAARRIDVVVRGTDSFDIESHGLEGIVTDRDYKNVETPFDAEAEESLALGLALQIGKEKSIADTLSDTAVVTQNTTLSGTAQFNDYGNSDPLAKFATAQQTIEDAVGVKANIAIMNPAVRRVLRYHPAILEYVRGKVQPGANLSDAELADALEVDQILIGGAKYNSAKLGQTDVLANIWDKNVIFAVQAAAPQVGQITAGYRIGLSGKQPRRVAKEAQFNPEGSTKILCSDEYDYALTKAGALYLIKNAIA